MEPMTNILLSSFPGLGLPRTLSLPVACTESVGDVVTAIYDRLPPLQDQLIITTTSNKRLFSSDPSPISSLLPLSDRAFLPLRLSARVCGGKGGFGSQLRAAGGRMSSRKNRNQNQNPNGSNRNLDGRRLRVIDSAKDLARYLATKPEMEAREKEEKRKRWESVVDAAERREADIRSGKAGGDRARLDADYVESKDLAEEKTREAVLRAMREELAAIGRTGSESSVDKDGAGGSVDESDDGSSGSSVDVVEAKASSSGPTFFGWDEDEDDSEDDIVEEDRKVLGKGKAKAAM